jgi:triosephosphate isomerase
MNQTTSAVRRPGVVGTWKMNGGLASNEALLSSMLERWSHQDMAKGLQCSLAVPYPYLFQAAVRLGAQGISWGAQDVSAEASGAFTGEVSAQMLKDFEAEFSLVGHSERRARHGETDEMVALKACALAREGLTPVVCVGESLAIRDQGQAEASVCSQVRIVASALDGLGQLGKAAFAYEPIWAIGTGLTATPEQAQQMHAAMRRTLAAISASAAATVKLLYGGSVKAANAQTLFAQEDIDGGLIGGASLDAHEFLDIVSAAKER